MEFKYLWVIGIKNKLWYFMGAFPNTADGQKEIKDKFGRMKKTAVIPSNHREMEYGRAISQSIRYLYASGSFKFKGEK